MSGNPDPIEAKRVAGSVSELAIRPAFTSNRSAFAFMLLLVFAILLPEFISLSGAITRRDSYDIMPDNQGNYSFVAEEIFDNDEPIDLVFIGSSLIWNAVDTPSVQAELTRRLGRPARVFTFGHYFNSFDISYTQLRDLLDRKRVRMVALSVPRTPFTTGPSTTAYRFIRHDEDVEVVSGLPAFGRASLYACGILRSPRDLLTIARKNRNDVSRFADTLGADRAELGMGRSFERYEPFAPEPPALPAERMIYSDSTAGEFKFIEKPLPTHQDHYLEALVKLLREKNVPLMMINVPQYSEIDNDKIVERENWSRRFGTEIPLVGIAPSVLYSGLSDEQITKLHYDPEHMNANGNTFFTRAVLPAVVETFNKYATKNR